LELNLYDVPTAPECSGVEIEGRQVEMVRQVREAVRIPLAVKLSPFYASLPHFAMKLVAAGANGLVLFNRFFEPDIDLEHLEIVSQMHLSTRSELRLRLRWIAILSARVDASFALTGGAHQPQDVVKAVMSGADVVQMVSGILARGAGTIAHLRQSLAEWLEAKEYDSLAQMRGSMNLDRCPNPTWLERANYVQMIRTWSPYHDPDGAEPARAERSLNVSGTA
jgi:dihydroorotate dehydrogenase (fumarate)